jgi:hypothetical protein
MLQLVVVLAIEVLLTRLFMWLIKRLGSVELRSGQSVFHQRIRQQSICKQHVRMAEYSTQTCQGVEDQTILWLPQACASN